MRYFATTPKGLEPILEQELIALGAESTKQARGGVHFEGSFALALEANVWLRSAMRILEPVAEEQPAHNADALYDSARAVRWNERLTPRTTIAVDAHGKNDNLIHTHFIALKVKDGIVDQMRSAFGSRPNIDPKSPDVQIITHLDGEKVSFYLNLSGESLHRRGYRVAQTEAPLKESLAAALLLWAGYDGKVPFFDPMCGSGTLAIEAAFIALGRAPNVNSRFGFERWPNFNQKEAALLRNIRAEAKGRTSLTAPISVSDISSRAVDITRRNAKAAGVEGLLSFSTGDVFQSKPLSPPGMIATNPPYGERLGESSPQMIPFYKKLGEHFRSFGNHKLLLLSGSAAQERAVGLMPQKKLKVFNGPLECIASFYDIWDLKR